MNDHDENETGAPWAARLRATRLDWRTPPAPANRKAEEWLDDEWVREMITDGEVMLHVRGKRWDRSGKITVAIADISSGTNDKRARDAYMAELTSKQWTTSIKFAPTASVERAWSEIDRRLLPDARKMAAAIRQRIETNAAEERACAQMIERLIAATGDSGWQLAYKPDEWEGRLHGLVRVSGPERLDEGERHGSRPYGDLQVYGQSVNLKLSNLSHGQTVAILEALAQREPFEAFEESLRAGGDPAEEFAAELVK